ncbi:MAG: DUF72 domain-containing protein [Chloroflexi bacterium]|nr:DUF72 domain-containing protein [Chloroflexota bacterium]
MPALDAANEIIHRIVLKNLFPTDVARQSLVGHLFKRLPCTTFEHLKTIPKGFIQVDHFLHHHYAPEQGDEINREHSFIIEQAHFYHQLHSVRAHSVIHIGCAGWSIPKAQAELFPTKETHLQRYAARFPAVEINSSFYRLHRPQTYARWAASTPAHFRFAVKMPCAITHYGRLKDASGLAEFLAGPRELKEKLGPLLVQLPPSLAFERDVAEEFFAVLREQFEGHVSYA